MPWSGSTRSSGGENQTQASLPSQDADLLLLLRAAAQRQIRLRAIDGWRELKAVKEAA